jgi:hypothetical protein
VAAGGGDAKGSRRPAQSVIRTYPFRTCCFGNGSILRNRSRTPELITANNFSGFEFYPPMECLMGAK